MLVVGLGNPGRQYVGTRHNVGWEVLDRLAVKLGWISQPSEFDRIARSNFDGLLLDGPVATSSGTRKLLLLKPTTYMNLSGRSVRAAMDFYQLQPTDLMIVLDEMALPCGRIRIRSGGSDGGHNGLRDIQRVLSTTQYPRLRVGVDSPPPRVPGRDYVLGRFTETQRVALEPAIDRAADAIRLWMADGINAAMNRFNADDGAAKKREETEN